ncbi:MAG TPA: immunoglobulin domain-containing protein, partial [Candidatus Hydrogenedentes bacterium]|nr:immunoglobulin domain-containing protein [Candidatus Hydrogenedentota bacterium]
LFFTDIGIAHEGYYRCRVSNLSGEATSNHARLGVERAPEITRQPDSLSVPAGFDATFFLEASGTIWSYTWEVSLDPEDPFGWSIVSSSTIDPNLEILGAQAGLYPAGDEGYYRCEVSGAGYFVYSRVVTLTVTDPGIVKQPQSRSVNPGVTLNPAFTVEAVTAYPPLSYTWYHDGVPLAAPNSPNLALSAIAEEDEGEYWVVVTNSNVPAGTAQSEVAYLTVNDPPVIRNHPEDVTTDVGTGVQLFVTASCDFPMSFQWYRQPLDESLPMEPILDSDGLRISGYTESAPPGVHTRFLEIFPSIQSDEGYYQVEVNSLDIGSVISNRARVILGRLLVCGVENPPLPCLTPLGDTRVYVNHTLQRFTMSTTGGSGTRFYQWMIDREDGNGFVPARPVISSNADPFTAQYDIIGVQFSHAGIYRCDATDNRPFVVSTPEVGLDVFSHLSQAVLANGEPVVIVTEEGFFLFEVGVSGGMPPLEYQWEKETGAKAWEVLAITTVPSFLLEDIQMSDEGNYRVVVTDDGTDVRTSNAVYLDVKHGVPAVSLLSLGLAAGLTALAGAASLRRRRK